MKNPTHFDRIYAYAEGQMDESQRSAFEAELATNTELRAEYDAFLASQKVLEVLAFEELGKMANKEKKERAIVPIWRRAWAQAAAVLLLIGLGLFWYANQNYSPQVLAEQSYIEPNVSTTRNAQEESLLDKAAFAFETGDLEKAIKLASAIPADSLDYLHGQFILGHAYFQTGKMELAMSAFEKITEGDNSNSAEFHRALAYLKTGEIKNAETILRDISAKKDHDFTEQARALIEKINSGWQVFVI